LTGFRRVFNNISGRRARVRTAFVILAVSSMIAFFQSPRPLTDPVEDPSVLNWLAYPLELNPLMKAHHISVDLNGIFHLSGTGHVWIVGNGGLILHSMDNGKTWGREFADIPSKPADGYSPGDNIQQYPEEAAPVYPDGGIHDGEQADPKTSPRTDPPTVYPDIHKKQLYDKKGKKEAGIRFQMISEAHAAVAAPESKEPFKGQLNTVFFCISGPWMGGRK